MVSLILRGRSLQELLRQEFYSRRDASEIIVGDHIVIWHKSLRIEDNSCEHMMK